ncbi:unnamed protein product [Ambrosiozyma monospora]|uniref:Unnamed protein product n=1 Tax=Ambrosiozyma monospora TaxID=43982 RepID=A0ACB5STI1_AMBMO|nr:unnamed protein product [Ambrosiozyma monospora]
MIISFRFSSCKNLSINPFKKTNSQITNEKVQRVHVLAIFYDLLNCEKLKLRILACNVEFGTIQVDLSGTGLSFRQLHGFDYMDDQIGIGCFSSMNMKR